MTMRTFDVTLRGFDVEVAETDDLTKWVGALCEDHVRSWLEFHDLMPYIRSITDLGERGHNLTFADGLDILLSTRESSHCYDREFLPGLWEIVLEPFDPVEWIKESQDALRLTSADNS